MRRRYLEGIDYRRGKSIPENKFPAAIDNEQDFVDTENLVDDICDVLDKKYRTIMRYTLNEGNTVLYDGRKTSRMDNRFAVSCSGVFLVAEVLCKAEYVYVCIETEPYLRTTYGHMKGLRDFGDKEITVFDYDSPIEQGDGSAIADYLVAFVKQWSEVDSDMGDLERSGERHIGKSLEDRQRHIFSEVYDVFEGDSVIARKRLGQFDVDFETDNSGITIKFEGGKEANIDLIYLGDDVFELSCEETGDSVVVEDVVAKEDEKAIRTFCRSVAKHL